VEKIYQVCSWGPDGQDDVVYLVQASSFGEAATLVDQELPVSEARSQCSGFANAVIELGDTLASERGARVVSGPYFSIAAARGGFRCWSRDYQDADWCDWSDENDVA
jgi:hypothetical protein